MVMLALLFSLFLAFPTFAAEVWEANHDAGNTNEWCNPDGPPWTYGRCLYSSQIFPSPAAAHAGAYGLYSRHANPGTGSHDGKVDRATFAGTAGYIQAGVDRYYVAWIRIVEGYADQTFRNTMQWKGFPYGNNCGVSFYIGPRKYGADPREMVVVHQACQQGSTACRDIAGDLPGQTAGLYRQLNPIPVPANTWIQLQAWYKPATNGGRVIFWQDGVEIFDITHANLNTLATSNCPATTKMFFSIGNYVSTNAVGAQTLHADTVQINTAFVPVTGDPGDPDPPTQSQKACRFESATGPESAPTTVYGNSITITAGESRRLRCALQSSDAEVPSSGYNIRWSNTGTSGVFAGAHAFCDSTHPHCFNAASFPDLTHGQATTDAGLDTGPFVPGKIRLDETSMTVAAVPEGSDTELVAGIHTEATTPPGTYHFRWYRSNAPIEDYPVGGVAQMIVEAPDPEEPVPGNLRNGLQFTGGLKIQ